MQDQTFTTHLHTEAETQTLARKIGDLAAKGDVFLLNGPVGAGKSSFARAFIKSRLIVPEDIPSPTFTLVQTYPTPDYDIWHCDLYRLSSSGEVFELGLDEAFECCVTLIEWPDRLGQLTPKNALHINLDVHQEERSFTAVGSDPKWQKLRPLFD